MLRDSLIELLGVGGLFCGAAILLRGLAPHWWRSGKTLETLTNVQFYFFDGVLIAPALAMLSAIIAQSMPPIVSLGRMDIPLGLQFAVAVLLSDLAGYWRHRLLHTSALWPSHAVHHSDQHVQWLTLIRIHPTERLLNTLFDSAILAVTGIDVAVVVANNLLRHYYGYLLHADLGSRLGLLRYVFVTPHFHRWHHSDLEAARNKNFAVVFSALDLVFGTYYCPREQPASLGVAGMGRLGFLSLMVYPFAAWARSCCWARSQAVPHPLGIRQTHPSGSGAREGPDSSCVTPIAPDYPKLGKNIVDLTIFSRRPLE